MDDIRKDRDREHGPAVLDRRKFLVAGMGFAAAPLLTRVAAGTAAAQTDAPVGNNPFSVRAWGLIGPNQISQAYDRVVNKDVRYRFVIDFASSKSKEEK